MSEVERNWAGNYTYSTAQIHYPESLAELQEVVAHSPRLRVLGSRHSFNGIGDSTEKIVSLEKLSRKIDLDRADSTVTISGGMRYGDICEYLHGEGCALHNLASLPHISIAGAIATATHGSGVGNGNLATAVSAIEFVTAEGNLRMISRQKDGEHFLGAVVGLGALGVVTRVTLDVVPAFDVRQFVYRDLPLSQLENHFDDIMASAYSVSLFTNWQSDTLDQIWVKHRLGDDDWREGPPEYYTAQRATENQHPIPGHSAESCTPQLGLSGPWYERLPHFRLAFTPSSGKELQSEYFVAREDAYQALQAISRIREQVAPLLFVSEIRTIAADKLWLSPCYEQDSIGLHFTWHPDWPAVSEVLPIIEDAVKPASSGGKSFTMRPEQVQAAYEKMPDFQQLLKQVDPGGKFRNAFIDKYIFGSF